MGKRKKDAKWLAESLNEDLSKLEIKERKTFHRATEQHGKSGKAKNRHDRQQAKRNLKKGDWDS